MSNEELFQQSSTKVSDKFLQDLGTRRETKEQNVLGTFCLQAAVLFPGTRRSGFRKFKGKEQQVYSAYGMAEQHGNIMVLGHGTMLSFSYVNCSLRWDSQNVCSLANVYIKNCEGLNLIKWFDEFSAFRSF